MSEWAPPASYYQSSQSPVPANTPEEWAPPTSYYQSAPPVSPNAQQGEWGISPNYQAAPQQQRGSPPTFYPGPPPFPGFPGSTSPQVAHFVPTDPTNASRFLGVAQLELTIPPKYHGDVVDKQGTRIYHLSTANALSTVISHPNGTAVGRIDWKKKANHTSISIGRNKWQRDELLHFNKDKTYTFQVKAANYTWKGFQNGIQCFDPSGFKVAEFSYRTGSIITLNPANAAHIELVIITALLIHHEKSHHHEGIGKLGEGVTEGVGDAIGEAVVKGLFGAF